MEIVETAPRDKADSRILRRLAESSAEAWLVYGTDLVDLVDVLQEYAVDIGLVAAIGQDAVQEIIAAPFAIARLGIEAEEAPLQPEPALESAPREYRPPDSTVAAFWCVVRTGDEKQLTDWLADHPLDVPHLHQLWREKCPTQAA
jgi:hypothetical protein